MDTYAYDVRDAFFVLRSITRHFICCAQHLPTCLEARGCREGQSIPYLLCLTIA